MERLLVVSTSGANSSRTPSISCSRTAARSADGNCASSASMSMSAAAFHRWARSVAIRAPATSSLVRPVRSPMPRVSSAVAAMYAG
ncbi:hypothetical protein ACIA49_19640 [Kribbella sp. NPDC051587]|uniref:hypothetical protein n=1 Tax=Kribbella sp. NPDC051587 TaxID=3364119 RepID=UPI0037B955C1